MAAVTAFGVWLGRRRAGIDDYFLGGRQIPWWAVAACIVATETSTLTFIGVPGTAYTGDWRFLQLAFGYVIGRFIVSLLLVPAYFRGVLFTSYELLQQRLGNGVRTLSSGIFLVSRTLADGIRLHACALVLALGVTGSTRTEWVFILLLGAAMIVYTEQGGVKATVWTDTVQLFVYLAGAIVCVVAVSRLLPQGAVAALGQAAAAGKLRLIDTSFDLHQPFTLWAGLIGGVFLTLATQGTDHYLVQRLLVARSQREAAVGMALTGPLVLIQFVLFLVLGSLLWVYYGGRAFARGDEVLPTFIATGLPPAATGFILAAIVAAALSPSLNSMASVTVRDFYVPHFRPQASEREQLRLGRLFTVVWGLAQIGMALLAQGVQSALEKGLAVLGYASGPTVGAFLLAVLTRRATGRGTLVGMSAGLVASLVLLRAGGLGWTWNVAVGGVTTFAVGWAASLLMRRST